MKEKMKTLLLLFLIGTSIIMTRNLWMKTPDEALVWSEDHIIDEDDYSLLNIISPSRYLLNFGSASHTFLYDDHKYKVWEEGKDLLIDIFSSKDYKTYKIRDDEYLTYKNRKSIVFKFPEKINTYILAKALKVDSPNELVNILPRIDSIYIYLGDGSPFFVFSYMDENIRIDMGSVDTEDMKLKLQKIKRDGNYSYYYPMRDTLDTDNNVFIPYETDQTMADIYIDNMVLKYSDREKDQIAERFLEKDIDYIKEIVEGNKTNIYTYNKKLLKLNSKGYIEYFNPLEEDVIDRNLYQSLTTASKFIKDKSRMIESIYLDRVEEIEIDRSLGYRLTFKYRIRGIPVILGNQEVAEYLSIEVFNNHIRNYIHYARGDSSDMNSGLISSNPIMSAFDVIDENYEIIEEKYMEKEDSKEESYLVSEILSSIDSIKLAYFDPCLKEEDEKLIAIWQVRFRDMLLAFDAYNGKLIYSKNI